MQNADDTDNADFISGEIATLSSRFLSSTSRCQKPTLLHDAFLLIDDIHETLYPTNC